MMFISCPATGRCGRRSLPLPYVCSKCFFNNDVCPKDMGSLPYALELVYGTTRNKLGRLDGAREIKEIELVAIY